MEGCAGDSLGRILSHQLLHCTSGNLHCVREYQTSTMSPQITKGGCLHRRIVSLVERMKNSAPLLQEGSAPDGYLENPKDYLLNMRTCFHAFAGTYIGCQRFRRPLTVKVGTSGTDGHCPWVLLVPRADTSDLTTTSKTKNTRGRVASRRLSVRPHELQIFGGKAGPTSGMQIHMGRQISLYPYGRRLASRNTTDDRIRNRERVQANKQLACRVSMANDSFKTRERVITAPSRGMVGLNECTESTDCWFAGVSYVDNCKAPVSSLQHVQLLSDPTSKYGVHAQHRPPTRIGQDRRPQT